VHWNGLNPVSDVFGSHFTNYWVGVIPRREYSSQMQVHHIPLNRRNQGNPILVAAQSAWSSGSGLAGRVGGALVSEQREGWRRHLCEREVVAMEATWAHGSSVGERPLCGRGGTGAEEARRLLSLWPCTNA
jgi:hypothetical protein